MVKPIGEIIEQIFNARVQRGKDAKRQIFNAETQRGRDAGKKRDWNFLRYTQEYEVR